MAVSVDDELREVPFDLGVLLEVLVLGLQERVHLESGGAFAEAFEALLLFEEGVEGKFVLAVDVGLLHLRELGLIAHAAERGDLLVGAGRLVHELVAGDVDDFKALVVVLLVHRLDGLVLRGEAAAGGGVDDEHDFALVLCDTIVFAEAGLEGEIVNACHSRFLLWNM